MTFDEIFTMISSMVQQNTGAFSAMGDFSADLNITGRDGGTIGARIKNGVPSVQLGTIGSPEAAVSISAGDFSALVTGKLNPVMAFMTGRIKVSGDYGRIMELMKGFKS